MEIIGWSVTIFQGKSGTHVSAVFISVHHSLRSPETEEHSKL
jgi:hypothetical protein